jgi:DNA helicase-4
MELKATSLGKRLAQHPYDRVVLLNAGVKVSGEKHEYLIPFNQLLAIHCKRGLVWGELEFVLPADKVVRLHGTEWAETQRFHHHLNALWQQWSAEMSDVAARVLQQVLADIADSNEQNSWLTRDKTLGLQQKIAQALLALPLPTSRLDEFDNCRDAWRQCQAWLKDIDQSRLAHNQAWTEAMLTRYADFFAGIESSPLNPAQARAVVNGEHSLLVLAGAGSGKTSVLVARAGWLLARGEAAPDQILLLAFGRKAAQEMDERIEARLHTQDITARTFHALALHIIQQGSKKVPVVSKLENDTAARHALFIKAWQQQCSEKKAQAKGWRQWLEEELNWTVPEGSFWQNEKLARRLAPRLDRWVSLMRMQGGSQSDMIANAPEAIRDLFSKRFRQNPKRHGARQSQQEAEAQPPVHQAAILIVIAAGKTFRQGRQQNSPQRHAQHAGRKLHQTVGIVHPGDRPGSEK